MNEEIEEVSFSDRLIRPSAGLEDSDDIITDLEQAFTAAKDAAE
jgi:cystathionine beta-lyase/cystathionine gamma-synthase